MWFSLLQFHPEIDNFAGGIHFFPLHKIYKEKDKSKGKTARIKIF